LRRVHRGLTQGSETAVTSLTIEHFDAPSSARRARSLDSVRRRALDELGGRTVWCAAALTGGRSAAQGLRARLEHAGEGPSTGTMEVGADEVLGRLAQRLETLLRSGSPRETELRAADRDVYAEGLQDGEALVGREVRPDDVVVLHDPITAALAQAVRERGAHAVWHVSLSRARGARVRAVRMLLDRHTTGIDALVMTWRLRGARGTDAERVAALMPSADAVAAKEIPSAGPELAGDALRQVAWVTTLADVVHGDRGETVGGTLHPRPFTAAR
jgi:trehalose synthase